MKLLDRLRPKSLDEAEDRMLATPWLTMVGSAMTLVMVGVGAWTGVLAAFQLLLWGFFWGVWAGARYWVPDLRRERKLRIYIAAPYGGDPANLQRAARWYGYLCDAYPQHDFEANWIVLCQAWDESRLEDGVKRDLRQLRACDEIWLVGGEISPGMLKEWNFARAHKIGVRDMTDLGKEPPL